MVRAKFKCNYVQPVNTADGWQGTKVVLNPVGPTYKDNKQVWPEDSGENQTYWDSSPSGELTLYIKNPSAAEYYVQGQEYYLDFTKANISPV